MYILNWISRLLIWPFIIAYNLVKADDVHEKEAIESSLIAALGIGFFIGMCVVIGVLLFSPGIDMNLVVTVFLIFAFVYLLSGVLFFFSEQTANYGLPWYKNGRW